MTLFDFYFATLASWRMHPGYLRDPDKKPSLEALAAEVIAMLEIRNAILQESEKWQDGAQQ